MKKLLYILGLICSIVIILIAIYTFINIYCIVSSINGQLYDGFGTPYLYNEPNSPYTIYGVLEIIIGGSLFTICKGNLKKDTKK